MYTLSVGALFKNESHSLREWIEHYLYHGVEHFYLVNDNSDDNFMDILKHYIDKNIVTLYDSNWGYYLGRQKAIYNTYILPHLKETQWLLIVDLDEYMWSPKCLNMAELLHHECMNLTQIQVNHTLYGSNSYEKQPKFLVNSFTKRSTQQPTDLPNGNLKYFINSNYNFSSLNVHYASYDEKNNITEPNHFMILGPDYFVLNHYCCQSKEFWIDIKCKRGDGDHYRERKEHEFTEVDINDVEDLSLYNQNKKLLEMLTHAN